MRAILHILTKPDDALAAKIIIAQQSQSDGQIKMLDLTKPDSDYTKLLEEIFAADSVAVW